MKKIMKVAEGLKSLKDQFMAYIEGGMFKGISYLGCKDKIDPVDPNWTYIPNNHLLPFGIRMNLHLD